MPATMRAAVLVGVDEPLALEERLVPEPGPGEVRVRVLACGVCGSDVFLQAGGFGTRLPVIPGHEAAGIVNALGPGVDGWSEGDLAALYYIDAAPSGRWARAGREQLDPGLTRMGVDVDGAFAEYVVRPAHTLVAPPAPIDPVVLAVLTDAVGTAYHALVRIGRVAAGETVLVLGVGGVGSNAVQLARELGARVVAGTRQESKRALAHELGADAIVTLTGDPDADAAALRGACGDEGPDVVVQCAGAEALDELAIAAAAPGGRVVLVGAAHEPFRARATDLIWRELSVMGSRGFTARDIADVLALHAEGRVRVDHLTRSVRPLEEVNDALDDLRAGRVMRTVLRPDLRS